MKKIVIFVFAIFLVISLLLFASRLMSVSDRRTSINAEKLFQVVNDWRTENGLQSFEKEQKLCDLATGRLEEVKVDWSHDQFWKHTSDIPNQLIGENLGKDMSDEHSLLAAWIESPAHLANLRYSYKYSCVASDGNYTVQLFANY